MIKRNSTRQQLLDILKRSRKRTIGEIMEYMTISEIAVRKQLHELEQQGLVQTASNRQAIGRPYLTYELTSKGHATYPNLYHELPAEILKDVEAMHGEDTVSELLRKRSDRETSVLKEAIPPGSMEEKVHKLVELQNEKGYMIDLESEGDIFTIFNYNCPVSNIASCYHQVCDNEKSMYEGIFPSAEVKAHSFIAEGNHVCKWTISQKKEE